MSGWLLDTNVLSELRRPKPVRKVVAFVAAQPLEELFVSSVTFAEIRFGIKIVASPARRAELNDWLMRRAAAVQGGLRAAPILDRAAIRGRAGAKLEVVGS